VLESKIQNPKSKMKVDTRRSKPHCDGCPLSGWRGVPFSAA
jgi:hypothetical protein